MASLQEGWRAEWATRAAALVARARDLACVVPPERLHRSPGQRRWSAAQVFEHLAIANESYLCFAIVVHHAERHFRQIDRALAASDPGRTPGPPDREGEGAGPP